MNSPIVWKDDAKSCSKNGNALSATFSLLAEPGSCPIQSVQPQTFTSASHGQRPWWIISCVAPAPATHRCVVRQQTECFHSQSPNEYPVLAGQNGLHHRADHRASLCHQQRLCGNRKSPDRQLCPGRSRLDRVTQKTAPARRSTVGLRVRDSSLAVHVPKCLTDRWGTPCCTAYRHVHRRQ